MVQLYDNERFSKIKKLRNKLLIIYFITLAVALALAVTIIVLNSLEPVNSPLTTIYRVILIVLICLYTLFSALYLEIVFGRVNKYFEKLNHLFLAKKQKSSVTFIRFNHTKFDSNGVSFYTMETLEWSDSKKDFIERYVQVDSEFELEEFKNGDILQILTVSNVLFAYQRENVDEAKSS